MLSKIYDEILSYFPETIKKKLNQCDSEILDKACEIRIRTGCPIIISSYNKDFITDYIVTTEDVLRVLGNFSDNSIYSIQNELNSGFITIKGGHRIGISGTSIFENEHIKNIKYISSLNIRIAREIKDCSLNIFNTIYKEGFENTIIISPPRMWKNYSFT